MKKLLLWMLVLVISISMILTFSLAGCKKEAASTEEKAIEKVAKEEVAEEAAEVEEEEKVRIVHLHWDQPPYTQIVEQTAKDFMKENPNVEVKVLFYADPDLAVKVREVLTVGGECDTFAINNFESAWFLENDLVEEIMPSAFGKETVEEVVDMWVPGSIQRAGGFYNGKYYGIPHELSNYVAWINVAHMKEVGLDPEKDIPETWDEFIDVCKKLTKVEGGIIARSGFATNIKAPIFPFLILGAMMEQKGLDWSTEEGIISSLDKPEALEAFSTFTNWVTVDRIWDPALFDDEREGFGNGLCSTFLTGGTWYWGVLEKYSVPVEDVIPFKYPRFEDGEDIGGPAYGYCVYVTKQASNKEWAWKWLDYLESRPEVYIAEGYYQPRKSMDPALAEENIGFHEVFVGELSKGAKILVSSKMNEIRDAVGLALDRVIFEGMSNEDSIKALKEDIEGIISK